MIWRKYMRCTVLGLLMLIFCFSIKAQEAKDFQEYIQSIKKDGMSESAKSSLQTIASIRVEVTILSFTKNPETGLYETSYMSSACPNPKASKEEQQKFFEK